MRVAIVHDYLNQKGGAERVVGVLHRMFPSAPIFTTIADRQKLWSELQDARISTTWMQHIPNINRLFKLYFWLYPLAMRSIKLDNYDVIISSSSAYAKGVPIKRKKGSKTPVHICYCHTPMRFAWDFHNYISDEKGPKALKLVARTMVPALKKWDLEVNQGVDQFIANSYTVKSRIEQTYGRDAIVVHPPVDTRKFNRMELTSVDVPEQPFFLVVSRLVSYKRLDLAVQACTKLGKWLLVIGEGPDRTRLEAMAGPKVKFLGWQPENMSMRYMNKCQALIFPGKEDFGITPVEVNAAGRPVVAYRAGGALDTVVEGVSGLFFDKQDVDCLMEALKLVEQTVWHKEKIEALAERFSKERFAENFHCNLQSTLKRHGLNFDG